MADTPSTNEVRKLLKSLDIAPDVLSSVELQELTQQLKSVSGGTSIYSDSPCTSDRSGHARTESIASSSLSGVRQRKPYEYASDSDSMFSSPFPGEAVDGKRKSDLKETVELLRLELEQKELQSESQRMEFEAALVAAEHEKNALKSAKRELEEQLDREMKSFVEKCTGLQRRTEAEIQSLRKKQEEMESQNPTLTAQYERVKKDIVEYLGIISEREYKDLCKTPFNKRTLLQCAQARTYELVAPVVEERNALDKQLADFQKSMKNDSADGDSASTIRLLEADKKRLSSRVGTLQAQLADLQTTAAEVRKMKFDKDTKDRQRLAHEHELQRTLKQSKQLQEKNKLILDERDRLESKVHMLERDKSNLVSMVGELRDRLSRTEDMLGDERDRVNSLMSQKSDFVTQLKDLRSSGELNMKKEVEKLQRHYEREVSALKNAQQNGLARETQMLQVARDEALKDNDRLRSECDTLRSSYSELQGAYHALELSSQGQLSELRQEIRTLAIDVERKAVQLDNVQMEYKRSVVQRQVLVAKVDTLKQEYFSLEQEGRRRAKELQAEVDQAQQKALLGTAAVQTREPSGPETLLRQISTLQTENNKLSCKLKHAEHELKRATEMVHGLEKYKARVAKPQKVLCQKISDLEEHVERLEEATRMGKAAEEKLKDQNTSLAADLRDLICTIQSDSSPNC